MVNFLHGLMSIQEFRRNLFLDHFYFYINDLTNDLSSSAKLFEDDISLFSVVFNVDVSANESNDVLAKVQNWVLQWKMSFNPDISKQAQEVIFSRKLKAPHPPFMFNSNEVNKTSVQKHLGIIWWIVIIRRTFKSNFNQN